MLTKLQSCDRVTCSDGKPGYRLPGECCESCSKFLYILKMMFHMGKMRSCNNFEVEQQNHTLLILVFNHTIIIQEILKI